MKERINISIDLSGIWEVAIFVFIIFLILKLTKLIFWNWVWVFSPLWIVGGITLIVFLAFVVVLMVKKLAEHRL